ncbi:MAG: amidohydrolase family protein [Dehalococcoidia bacterium]
MSIEPNITRVPRHVDDRALYPFYQRCDELGLPVLITCVSGLGPYVDYTDPLRFDRIATDFPNLSFDMVHGGWPLVEQALAVAFKCPNVYIQPDQYLNYEMPGFKRYVQAANTFLSDRLIFGSAYPACGLYKDQLPRIRRFPFKDTEALNKYLGGNALRLLNLAG